MPFVPKKSGFVPNVPTPTFTTGTSNPATDLGGIGVTMPRDEAQKIAAQRLIARERATGFRPGDLISREEAQQLADQAGIPLGNIGNANVMSTAQFSPDLQGRILENLVSLRSAGSAAGLGVPTALQRVIEDATLNEAQKKIFGLQSTKERAPEAAASGNIVGSLAPTKLVGGAALSEGAPLLTKFIQGVKVGAPVGATVGAAGAIEEKGSDTTVKDFVVETLKGTGLGAAFGGGIPILANMSSKVLKSIPKNTKAALNPIKTLEDAGVIKTPEAHAVDLRNPTGEGAISSVADDIVDGTITQPFQIIKSTAPFKDVPTLIVSGEKTLENLGGEVNTLIKENPNIVISGADAAESMVKEAASDPLLARRNPEIVANIRDNAQQFNRDIPLGEAFDLLKSINGRHKNYFTATAKGQNTALQDAEFATDEIARKYLSRKIDDATQGITGEARNAFREYGMVNGTLMDVQKRYATALVDRLKQTSKGNLSDFIKNFDITRPLASLNRPLEFLRGGELGRINKVAASLNDKLGRAEAPVILSTEERLSKLKGKVKSPPVLTQDEFDQLLIEQARVNQIPFAPSPGQVQETIGLENNALQERLQELLSQPYP